MKVLGKNLRGENFKMEGKNTHIKKTLKQTVLIKTKEEEG